MDRNAQVSCGRLPNSAFLSNLELYLSYLHDDQRSSVIELIRKYPALFHDVPSQTTVVSHDIDVGECPPIKQHPYRVNPHKRQLMKNEVDYCCNMDLLYPAKVHGVLLVCLFPSLITLYDFVLTTGKWTMWPNQTPYLSLEWKTV